MKTIFLVFITISTITKLHAQHTTYSTHFSTNAFAYKGNATTNTSFINDVPLGKSYTNNPYGNKTAFNWGLHIQVKRITKQKFIYGSSLGFDVFASKLTILQPYIPPTIGPGPGFYASAKIRGTCRLVTKNISTTFFGGYRIVDKKIKLDIQAGLELNYILTAKEEAKAISERYNFKNTTNVDRKNLKLDVKPFVQLTAEYKRFYVFVSYARGLPSYAKNNVGGNTGAFSSLVRFGIGYAF